MRNIVLAVIAALSAPSWSAAQGRLQDVIASSYAAEAGRDIAGAMKVMRSVEETEGDSYIYRLRMGWLAYLGGMWNESIAQYQNAAKIAPEAIEPLQGLLLPLAAAGKTAEISRAHEMVLAIDPNNYKSLSQLAWINYQAKDYKKAVKYYARIIKLYPTDVEMLLGLGYSLKLEGDRGGSERVFKQVLMLSPKNARALEGLKGTA
ncbi:MAG: tetratricopeptide repeat protein [Elusimicrobia bacterium]|nr:tetratricopeptide repeat protein [Elusimicrobiota bacterium]